MHAAFSRSYCNTQYDRLA